MRCLTLWDVVADSYFYHQIVSRLHCYNSDVGFSQLGCRIFTTQMSDFYNSDVGFLQLKSRIFKSQMSDFQQL